MHPKNRLEIVNMRPTTSIEYIKNYSITPLGGFPIIEEETHSEVNEYLEEGTIYELDDFAALAYSNNESPPNTLKKSTNPLVNNKSLEYSIPGIFLHKLPKKFPYILLSSSNDNLVR